MKKNYCLWILLSCNVFLAQAQLVKVERSYKINKETPGFYPVFSNDGKELLYTSENYKGLFLYDLKSKTSDVITEVDGAGYNPAFDRNGAGHGESEYASAEHMDVLSAERRKKCALCRCSDCASVVGAAFRKPDGQYTDGLYG